MMQRHASLVLAMSGFLAAIGGLLFPVRTCPAQEPGAGRREFNPRVVLQKPIRPIVDVPLLAADEVTDEVSSDELVLGVVVDGKARAYPINMLTGPRREIINDRLGSRAIAATW